MGTNTPTTARGLRCGGEATALPAPEEGDEPDKETSGVEARGGVGVGAGEGAPGEDEAEARDRAPERGGEGDEEGADEEVGGG